MFINCTAIILVLKHLFHEINAVPARSPYSLKLWIYLFVLEFF